MRRFHHPGLPAQGAFTLDGDEGAHLARVLRARPGDEVLVFDGRGRMCICRVTETRKDAASLDVVSEVQAPRPARDVLLLTAAPRGDRMEWLVEKCVEAGVSSVVPWAAARSVRDRAGGSTLRRWRRAALEACKQCGRADVPEVSDVVSFDAALRLAAGRVLLVASPGAAQSVEDARGAAEAVALCVGPEGGFSPEEEAALGGAGGRAFGLGPLVLRIETAAAFAVHRAAW